MPLVNPVIPMTIDEFHVMEHRLGWKHEYWDGAARLSCQPTAVASWELKVESTPNFVATINSNFQLRKLTVQDRECLVELFVRVFDDAVEYAGWSNEHFHRDALDSVSSLFTEAEANESLRVGGLLEHSFGFFSKSSAIAAILLRQKKLGPTIEPIMVDPVYQRLSLGTALLGVTLQSVRNAGIGRLYSRTHLGNSRSLRWHERRGFQEIPEYFASSHRAMHYHWQADHFRHRGNLLEEETCRKQAIHWNRLAQELQTTKGFGSDLC